MPVQLNAYSPIFFKDEGSVTFTRLPRFENTEDEISVTFSEIIMLSGVATSARKNVDDCFSA